MYFYIYNIVIFLEKNYFCRPELFSHDKEFLFTVEDEYGNILIRFNVESFEDRKKWIDSIIKGFRNIDYMYKEYTIK